MAKFKCSNPEIVRIALPVALNLARSIYNHDRFFGHEHVEYPVSNHLGTQELDGQDENTLLFKFNFVGGLTIYIEVKSYLTVALCDEMESWVPTYCITQAWIRTPLLWEESRCEREKFTFHLGTNHAVHNCDVPIFPVETELAGYVHLLGYTDEKLKIESTIELRSILRNGMNPGYKGNITVKLKDFGFEKGKPTAECIVTAI